MKQLSALLISGFLAAFTCTAVAQDDNKLQEKKKSEEIVIRKMGDKDIKLTIEIKGDNVTVNGKPLVDFKDDAVSIDNRKVIVRDGYGLAEVDRLKSLGTMGNFDSQNFGWTNDRSSKVVLGVTTEKTDGGIAITNITEGSAAEKAGLKEGDVITKFGDTQIEDPQGLYDAVNKKKAKDEVKIDFKRDGKDKSVKATLQERKEWSYGMTTPNGTYKSYSMPKYKPSTKNADQYQFGPGYDMSDHMDFAYAFSGRPKLGLKIQDTDEGNGVKVLEVEANSSSAKAGMKAEDVITEIGGEKVLNTDEAREALLANNEKSTYKIKAKRNGSEMTFDIKIPKKLKTANL
jgi:serine protease Do